MTHNLRKKQINFAKFFLILFLWLIFTAVLFTVTYLFLNEILFSDKIKGYALRLSTSIVYSVLLLTIYKIQKTSINKILNKDNKELNDFKTRLSEIISGLQDIIKQNTNFDKIYEKGINTLCKSAGIDNAVLYLRNEELKIFEPVHLFNIDKKPAAIQTDNDIITAGKENLIIDKILLIKDRTFKKVSDVFLDFLYDNNFELALPVFSGKNELMGMLFLGSFSENNEITENFIPLLDNYRTKFGILLENLTSSMKEEKLLASEGNKLIVKNIKNRIIPVKINTLADFTISSLFINNSDAGGDFFNSVKTRSDKLGIYLANTSDAGIESSLLALQMSSVFHAQADTHESPDGLLNIINRVICTSRLTEKYATAFYMIYNKQKKEIGFSNAAFNPLLLYSPKNQNFEEFDTEGIPVGIDPAFNYKHGTIETFPGCIGLCFSQGIFSAINNEGNNYSLNRIKDVVSMNKNDSPATLVKKIYEDIKFFTEGVKLLNDITLIMFKAA